MKQKETEKLKPVDEIKSAQQNALYICTRKGLDFLRKK
jgi:hypothetical protein